VTSPLEVGKLLGQITHEIGRLTVELGKADREARRARAEYDRACAVAFRQTAGSGSIEARKYQVVELTHGRRLAAEDAASRVADLKERLKYARDRIDVGRSLGAALRAEAAAVNTTWEA
jgi:hypothetical protein